MVSAARKDARKEREPLERRNEQLQAQLNDAELLLASHQEQLSELKMAMQDMSKYRNELDTDTNTSTAPSTPAMDNQDQMNRIFDALNLSPTTPGGEEIPPAPPTTFTHLVHPILRMDLAAFEDFRTLLEMSRKSQPSSRVTSGTFNGLGMGNLTSNQPDRMPSTSSTSSLTTSNVNISSPSTPNLASSSSSSFSTRESPIPGTPLKETPFYKRALTEDIEPTLRLDTAPGLSWLARRTVINSMCEGKLIVEPTPPTARLYHPPCTLCGEQGRGERHARTHRFRTNDSETAQRYPLCKYCLGRIRASCDFLGFLRMIKDGHWRTEGAQAEAVAWEESVRLRERMFWSRIGGGVVPAFLRARDDTPRTSVEDEKTSSIYAASQTSLGSQDVKPEKPSPLAQESRAADVLSTTTTKGEPVSPMPLEPNVIVEQRTTEVGSPARMPSNSVVGIEQPKSEAESATNDYSLATEKRDSSEASSTRMSMSRTPARPRGSSRTESNGKSSIAGSVARRAAMFERTASDDGASKQLQANLQNSLKTGSPGKGRSPSPAVRKPVAEISGKPSWHERESSSIVPGSFDF